VTLTLDDAEAGQVGECTDCGAKFRVPVKKAAAPAKSAKGDTAKQRSRDNDDDEESDDQEEKPRKSAKPSKTKAGESSARDTIVLACGFLAAIVVLGTGGIFINNLGIIVTGVSLLLMFSCSMMIAREAWADGMSKFMMVWLIPLYLMYFVTENWSRTKQLFIPYMGFMILALVSAYSVVLHQDRVEEKRKATKAMLDRVQAVRVWEYRHG
jgi:hypothetical protein